jgi:hypothetical protein
LPKNHSTCIQTINQLPVDRNFLALFWQGRGYQVKNGQLTGNLQMESANPGTIQLTTSSQP